AATKEQQAVNRAMWREFSKDPRRLLEPHFKSFEEAIGDRSYTLQAGPELAAVIAKSLPGQDIAQVENWLGEVGGNAGQGKRVIPGIYGGEEGGVAPITLFEVRGKDGKDYLIDGSVARAAAAGHDVPWKYSDLRNYQEENRLPKGNLYLPGYL